MIYFLCPITFFLGSEYSSNLNFNGEFSGDDVSSSRASPPPILFVHDSGLASTNGLLFIISSKSTIFSSSLMSLAMTEASNIILFQSVNPPLFGLSAKSMSTKRPVFTMDSLIGLNFRAEAFKSKGSSSPILSTVDEKIELIRDFVEFVNRFDVFVERIEERGTMGDSQPGISLKSIIGYSSIDIFTIFFLSL